MNDVWTIGSLLEWTNRYFIKYGIPDPRLEAEILLASVMHCPRLQLVLKRDDTVSENLLKKYKEFIVARQKRIPVAYILGRREFMGLDFMVNEHTLIPRPETELLVETAAKLMGRRQGTVIDLCTGSGCIAVSLGTMTSAGRIYACDISRDALKIAQANIDHHGQGRTVFVRHGDLFDALDGEDLKGKADMIVSNPPYIAENEFELLEPELAFEPRLALDGGRDGMEYYRRIAEEGADYVKVGGYLLLELSAARSAQTAGLVTAEGFNVQEIIKDYAGFDRVLVAQKRVKGAMHG